MGHFRRYKIGNDCKLISKAMNGSQFMAFAFWVLLIPNFAYAKSATVFFVIAGDALYKEVVHTGNGAQVKGGLQFEILDEVQKVASESTDLNTVIVYDGPEKNPSFAHYYEGGQLVLNQTLSDDFTNPETVASVIKTGYERLPSEHYYFIYWGFSIPNYPTLHYDMSHPNRTFSIDHLRQTFLASESYRDDRKFDSILLSTCYNSSFEVLTHLNAFTRSIVASEIYLYHRGFTTELISELSNEKSLDEKLGHIHALILTKLEEWTPRGPASGKPVLDISVSILKTEKYWDFFDMLEDVFSDLNETILLGDPKEWEVLLAAFQAALLKNSRGRVFDEPYIDLKTFVEKVSSLVLYQHLENFLFMWPSILFQHSAPDETNIQGMNMYLPVISYRSLNHFNDELNKSYLKGTALSRFVDMLETHYFEIFGARGDDDLPEELASLIPFYSSKSVSPELVQKYLKGEEIWVDEEYTGMLNGKGKYIGRLGTHELILSDGRRLSLKGIQSVNLDVWVSGQIRKYHLKGVLRRQEGALSHSTGAVLTISKASVMGTTDL